MKAVELVIKFIQRHGFEDTKKIIESIDLEMTHITCDGRMFVNENTQNLESHVVNQLSELVVIPELKRLVDSWELVERLGGIWRCKFIVREWESNWKDAFDFYMPQSRLFHKKPKARTVEVVKIKQAIADVESVGGGV